METVVILNNIRSNENVGSIFRTADAAGVKKIILCGYTPTPLDRFGRENKKLSKAALGAEGLVAWESFESLSRAVENLKEQNFKIMAVEQSVNSLDYRQIKQSEPWALVFGNEVEGLAAADLSLMDGVIEIPMFGQKESLNVAVSVGIVLYGLKFHQI